MAAAAAAAGSETAAGVVRASVAGADVVVDGGGKVTVVELPRDALLYGPGGDMNWPQPNPGAPRTPTGAMVGAEGGVVAGPGCERLPRVNGIQGFEVLCPYVPGASVQVKLGPGDDRLDVNGGAHGRYYGDVYRFLGVPLRVEGGAGDDRIDTQTVNEVRVDGGAGNDRLSLGLSGPANTLRGGPGDDSFSYGVTVDDYAYDLNPEPRTRRVDLDCGAGADTVEPFAKFRLGRGCPAPAPHLIAESLTLRGRCDDLTCHWQGPRRLTVTVDNPTSHRVTLHAARLSIERFDSEPWDLLFRTLAHRRLLSIPARGSARVVMPARKRRGLNKELNEYLPFGEMPVLSLTGALVDRGDGDRTTANVTVRIRSKPIRGFRPL
jgi:hypothetical protein